MWALRGVSETGTHGACLAQKKMQLTHSNNERQCDPGKEGWTPISQSIFYETQILKISLVIAKYVHLPLEDLQGEPICCPAANRPA